MSYDYYEIILIFFFLLLTSIYSSENISYHNITYGRIENKNFYVGESQARNLTCSWIITNENNRSKSYYLVSLRTLETEHDQRFSGENELVFTTDSKQIILDDISQQVLFIPSAAVATLEINFRRKTQWNSLNVRRFLLEFIHVTNHINTNDYFRCSKSGLIIPKQWKCNCLYECLADDYSDEEDCPLCSIVKSFNSLLCQSNETWCLPVNNRTDRIDPKGVCIPHDQPSQCSYFAKCETIISYYQTHGEIILDNSILSNRQSLCLIIAADDKHKIKLILNQSNLLNQRPDLELLVYGGSEQQNQLLYSSNWLSPKQVVQTHQNHIVTIIIRKRSLNDQDWILPIEEHDISNTLLNITWLTSVCPDELMVCGGHFELKCYTKKQRCDGVWDCISGDDELGCFPQSCPTTFACNDPLRLHSDQPRCYTWSERCNGNAFCANHTDERNCTSWWCNSKNGTFLCKNLNCIYETWACDGTNDCGDNSDETNCTSRIPRRIMTAIVIGATVCSTLFIIALGCTCKLLHLRSAERRASYRLLNPQRYIEQRREELHRQSHFHQTSNEDTSTVSGDTRRIAPPSYSQTMGFSDDNEERQAFLAEHLRLAGLASFIPLPSTSSHLRTSRHRNRRHRRHRRHRQRRSDSENSRAALLEPPVTQIHPAPSASHLDRFRSHFRSLFTPSLSINNNNISSNDFDIHERRSVSQPIILATRSFSQPRELPPPYAEEQLPFIRPDNDRPSSTSAPSTTTTTSTPPSTLIRIRKQQIPLHTFQDHCEQQQQPPSSPPIATIDDDDQASSDDDKMLVP